MRNNGWKEEGKQISQEEQNADLQKAKQQECGAKRHQASVEFMFWISQSETTDAARAAAATLPQLEPQPQDSEKNQREEATTSQVTT